MLRPPSQGSLHRDPHWCCGHATDENGDPQIPEVPLRVCRTMAARQYWLGTWHSPPLLLIGWPATFGDGTDVWRVAICVGAAKDDN